LRLGFSSITISLDHSAMQFVLFFHMADIFNISYVGDEKRASQIVAFVPVIILLISFLGSLHKSSVFLLILLVSSLLFEGYIFFLDGILM